MRRSYGYTPRQDSGWDTTSQDYHAYLSRMERMPRIIHAAPQYPNVHKAFNNKYTFEEVEEVEFQEEHQRKLQHSPCPKSQKKVQVEETIEETRDENDQVYEETTVKVEADGYIQQKHKGFELHKWKTFKVH
ncbi:hypothetical protein REPUB_Repub08aG0002100 [Reevesia pubescens]